MKYHSKPNLPDFSKLDFSEFHPLDHTVVGCRNYPGGRRTHLKYRWEFQVAPGIRAWTLCKVGIHHPGQFWQRDLTWIGCIYCAKKLSERQPE